VSPSTAATTDPRIPLVADGTLQGRSLCRALAASVDAWLVELFERAAATVGEVSGVALLAVGGYGRGELAPSSDLDLLLVHRAKRRDVERVERIASALWYPLWDVGAKLGHAVRTEKDQLELARTDLDTATSMLTARVVAGDTGLGRSVIDAGHELWRQQPGRFLRELHTRVVERREGCGDVAYVLEPDLKSGHGGLRDVQSLWWAAEAGLVFPDEDRVVLDQCVDVLLRARVALHRATGRIGDTMRLEDQDAAAASGGYRDADELMAEIAAAARRVAWIADQAWGRLGRASNEPTRTVASGVQLVDGEIELAATASPHDDPTLVLRVAIAAARSGRRIGRATLARMAAEVSPMPDPWPVGASDDLVALLLEGQAAIDVLEALDHHGLLAWLLPEWEPVRSKPQRNAYHRFTVDRHLWETAANAAALADRVARPDLLVLGGWFHDLGKGYPGDHTEVGIELVRRIGPRMGIAAADVDVVAALVEHHLLLPDVAIRRDLSDAATIDQVAAAVGTVEVLELLHALTEADSLATGPSAWGTWKADLVAELVSRTRHVLGGGDVREVTWRLFPDADTTAAMALGEVDVRADVDRITVVSPDRPGTFSRVAGVLSLHGLDVLSAQAHSDEQGMAASAFRVHVPATGIAWQPIVADMRRALAGELAIEARLAERARTYRRRRATQAGTPGPPSVDFHDDASTRATVLEVRAVSKIGILHRITKALAELGLDIRHATVQTLGIEVVDTFYVRTSTGAKVTDPFHRGEIVRAVLHAVS
jgi:[protein-PII] uridylyltransferase